MPENLFFLAALPPKPISIAIHDLKEQMAERYGSRHALKSPPHITLMPPFWFNAGQIPDLMAAVQEVASHFLPVSINLKNFSCFKPRVIFIDVKDGSGSLKLLQKELKDLFQERYKLRPDKRSTFHPHCTIGFKDLTPKMFYRAWDYYRTQPFAAEFVIEQIDLLKHTEGRWKVQ